MKKVVLITGASSGIGKVAAFKLFEKGFVVYATARRIEKMDDLKARGINVIKADVTDYNLMQSVVNQIIYKEGRIDILVNNAGYGSYGAVEDVSIEEAKYQFEVNLFSLAELSKFVIPHMRNQKSGRIINVSSVAGKISEPNGAWYHSSKFAVEGLSDCLRQELKPFGIDVVLIEPGPIYTEWNSIARDNLLKVSGNGAYKDIALKQYKFLEFLDKFGSNAEVIANAIVKAATVKRPKTRYVKGKLSSTLLFLRKLLPDKIYDWMTLNSINFIGDKLIKNS
jgi:short-subunit dehydrogenase